MAAQILTFRKQRMSTLERRRYLRKDSFSKPENNSILAKRKYEIGYTEREKTNEIIKTTPNKNK